MIDTFCKETVLYFPTNLRGNYSPEEAWGKLAKGGGNYSWEKTWGSSRRVAAASPGGSLGKLAEGCGDYSRRKPGEARKGLRRLLLETDLGLESCPRSPGSPGRLLEGFP